MVLKRGNINTLVKPSMKAVKRGQKGNQWTAYDIHTTEGGLIHLQDKAHAQRVFEANKRVYAVRTAKKKEKGIK
jgi:hypothetical protein